MDKYEGLNKYRLNGQIFKAKNAKEIVKSIENDPGISLPRLCYECGVSEEYAVLVMRAHGLACSGTDVGFKDKRELTSFRIWRNQRVEQVIGVVVDEVALVMEYCRNRPWVDAVRLTLESNKERT
tara:strand:+ start:1003 stop:1377 length:375 start_codon:yes stop_codon:yes gene_type:complete